MTRQAAGKPGRWRTMSTKDIRNIKRLHTPVFLKSVELTLLKLKQK